MSDAPTEEETIDKGCQRVSEEKAVWSELAAKNGKKEKLSPRWEKKQEKQVLFHHNQKSLPSHLYGRWG